jgi:hypothetical protein
LVVGSLSLRKVIDYRLRGRLCREAEAACPPRAKTLKKEKYRPEVENKPVGA